MTSDAPILPASAAGREQADPRRWAALIVLLLAAFMSLLDVSIVNIAIPSIQRGLHATYADVQWALAGYTLAYAIVLITGGRLGDMFGRKRLFLAGVVGFTAMSALCGAAQGPGMLIACRVVQGAMGAIMIPQVLAVIQVSFPPGERIKALAGYGATAGLGTVSGPLIGGLLVTHNVLGLGWRTIFLINVPVGIVAVIAALLFVRESRAPDRTRLDLGGLALLTVATLLLLYPLVQGRQLGWPAWSFASMAASAPVFALFAGYELSRSRRGGSPLVEMRMFGQRSFSVGIAIAVTFFLGVASFALVLTLFLQEGLNFSALHAGLTFVPFSLGVLVSSGVAARLAPRLGRTVTMAGALVMAAGMAGLIWTVHQAGPGVSTWQLVPGMTAVGFGMGAVLAPLADILLAGVRRQDAGSASGVLNTGFQIGNSIGLALIGVIFFGLLGSQSGPAVNATAPQIRAGLAAASVPAAAQQHIVGQFRACLHDRLVASDPTVTPPSCRRSPAESMLPAAANHVIAAGAAQAVKRDFTAALQRTLWYQVGAFLLAFLLMLALPRRAARSVRNTKPVHDTQALPAKG
jgi:EmrB/QacA subfamily drug resistance transporter